MRVRENITLFLYEYSFFFSRRGSIKLEKGKEKGNNERRSLFVECVKYTHTKQRSRNLDVTEVDPQADGRKRPKKKRKKQRSERR